MTDERRVVAITGAARGIGRATALELARAGFRLALADRDADGLAVTRREVEAAGGTAFDHVLDVAVAAEQASFAARCREAYGRADVLVNNAEVDSGPLECLSEADWRAMFEVNLLGVVLGIRAFLPLLRETRGHVVNVGSGTSLLPFPGFGAYGSLKVSVLWLSEYLACELAPARIRVSVVCPLLVRTGIGEAIQRTPGARQPDWLFDPPERIARAIHRAIRHRTFLVRGSWLLAALHLLYRAFPWFVRWRFRKITARQLSGFRR